MKKLFLFSVAALAFCACSNDETVNEKTVANQQPQEISFSPLAKPNTRAKYAVTTAVFPTDNSMEVAAYQTVPTTESYFTKCTFDKGSGATWKGSKFWPLSAAKINFFAVSGFGLTASHITIGNDLTTAGVAYTTANSYDETTQSDIMYAFGRGFVKQDNNALYFNRNDAGADLPVAMEFKHALALVDFEVKGQGATETANIKVNSITVKGGIYNGTLALANSNASTEAAAVTTTVTWTPGSVVASLAVPGITSPTAITDGYRRIGNGLMIIPGTGFASFVVNYTFDSKTYDYEYTLPSALTSVAANKYTYRINFKLHEIEIAPTVTEWTNTNNDITIVN